jgi:enamine deaminase RidA (YjgF/YER057c/UK114 family)
MKRFAIGMAVTILSAGVLASGCGNMDEAKVRELARDEAQNVINMQGANPEKFGFGVAWEKDFSYSQGTKVGNMLYIAGQLAHSRNVDANGMPTEDLMTGKSFEEQFRATLENMKAVLANYGGTMDDVVFLQNFVDPEAGGLKAGDYNAVAAPMIREYFPNGLQAMTFVEVVNLYGPQQLVESNAIAVLKPKAEAAPAQQ